MGTRTLYTSTPKIHRFSGSLRLRTTTYGQLHTAAVRGGKDVAQLWRKASRARSSLAKGPKETTSGHCLDGRRLAGPRRHGGGVRARSRPVRPARGFLRGAGRAFGGQWRRRTGRRQRGQARLYRKPRPMLESQRTDAKLQLDHYQELPYLVDPYLERIVEPVALRLRLAFEQVSRGGTPSSAQVARYCQLLYQVTKLRGYKTTGQQPSYLAERRARRSLQSNTFPIKSPTFSPCFQSLVQHTAAQEAPTSCPHGRRDTYCFYGCRSSA